MVVQKLPNQFHKKAVEVDNHLRVTGAPQGTIYAIGDASTVSPPLSILSFAGDALVDSPAVLSLRSRPGW